MMERDQGLSYSGQKRKDYPAKTFKVSNFSPLFFLRPYDTHRTYPSISRKVPRRNSVHLREWDSLNFPKVSRHLPHFRVVTRKVDRIEFHVYKDRPVVCLSTCEVVLTR